MRDPYLYDDSDVLKNRANIKNTELLRKAEADITNLAMSAIYERNGTMMERCEMERFGICLRENERNPRTVRRGYSIRATKGSPCAEVFFGFSTWTLCEV